MCAIAGFVGNLKRQDLRLMLDRMTHRGRDGSGIFFQDGIGLGNNRLAVIGRRDGKQPIQSQDGRLTLTFNGEIYNYREIKKELKRKGYVFKTATDTEVVLYAYAEYGEKCLTMFNGMFAFAIWDSRKKQLFMARDRVGIKPLFYTVFQNSVIFSSELKGLMAVSKIKLDINYQSIYYYLKLKYVPEPQTLFQEISHLPAGHYLIYKQNHEVSLYKYWDINNSRVLEISFEEAEKLLEEKLTSSIKQQLSSEVPLGIFASGGVDSGILSSIASNYKKNISLFHVGFKDRRLDEYQYVKLLSQRLGLNLYSINFKQNWVDRMPEVVWHLDQPLMDPAAISTFFLSEEAAKHVGVILSGDGADEIFAGYSRYKYLWYLKRALNPLFLHLVHPSDLYTAYLSNNFFADGEIQELLIGNLLTKIDLDFTSSWGSKQTNLKGNYLDKMLKTDLKNWLPGDILLKTDRMTAAHTLEARVPFLNHELVEFCLSLRPETKIKMWTDKAILRRLAINHGLPREISVKKKHGFNLPLLPFVRLAQSVLTREKIVSRGWFDYEYVDAILRQSFVSPRKAKQAIGLLMLELWAEKFLG